MAGGTDRPERAGNSPISGTRAELTVRLAELDVAAICDAPDDNVGAAPAGGSTTRIVGVGVVNDAGVTAPRAADESAILFDSPLAVAG